MSDWAKANRRGCAQCLSPAAWCRACTAEEDARRLSTENAALRVEVEQLTRQRGLNADRASMANRRAARLAETIAAWLDQHREDDSGAEATLNKAAELIRHNWSEESLDDDIVVDDDRDSLRARVAELEKVLPVYEATVRYYRSSLNDDPDDEHGVFMDTVRHELAKECSFNECQIRETCTRPTACRSLVMLRAIDTAAKERP